MTTMTRLQALPQAYCNEERNWYRGITAIDQIVVPVVKPEGFLTPDELFALDSVVDPALTPTGEDADPSLASDIVAKDPVISDAESPFSAGSTVDAASSIQ
jgi:hypothetical protein